MSAAAATGIMLQFDLGNSRVKWRALRGDQQFARGAGADVLDTQPDWRLLSPPPSQVLVASVASTALEQMLAASVRQCFGVTPWFARSSAQVAGLRSSYSEPGRLGVDRWLAMLAARERRRERLCVVDAGSALTIDLVAADGRHEGGYILPGATLMERALLQDTQRVRFSEAVSASLAPGSSTASCVHNGIALAEAGAVKLALERAGAPRPELFLTGGGAAALRHTLAPLPLQWCPDLVFEGLALLHACSL